MLQNPYCLVSKVMKSRYFEQGNFLEAVPGKRPSYAWRSILFSRELLLPGLNKKIGNGRNTRVWTEQWLFDDRMRAPLIKNNFIDLNLYVKDLIDIPNIKWNGTRLRDLFYPEDITGIMKNQPMVWKDDFWIWMHNKSGDFSVKSAYWLACQTTKSDLILEAEMFPSLNGLKTQVWSLQIAPKIKTFLWRVIS